MFAKWTRAHAIVKQSSWHFEDCVAKSQSAKIYGQYPRSMRRFKHLFGSILGFCAPTTIPTCELLESHFDPSRHFAGERPPSCRDDPRCSPPRSDRVLGKVPRAAHEI